MARYEDSDFSRKNVRRSKRLYNNVGRAKKTHDVRKEMKAEGRYYDDPVVKRQGKKMYEDAAAYEKAQARGRSEKAIDRVYGKKTVGKAENKSFYVKDGSGKIARKRKRAYKR